MHFEWKAYCFLAASVLVLTNPIAVKAQSISENALDRMGNPVQSNYVDLFFNDRDLVRVRLPDGKSGRASLIGRSFESVEGEPPLGSKPSGDDERQLYQIRKVNIRSNRRQVDCYFLGDFRDGLPWLRGELLANGGKEQYFKYILATDVWCTLGETDTVKILVEPPVNGKRQLELPVRKKPYSFIDMNYAITKLSADAGNDDNREIISDINTFDPSKDVFLLSRVAVLHHDNEMLECRPIVHNDQAGDGLFLYPSDFFQEVLALDLLNPNGFSAGFVGFYCSDMRLPSLRNIKYTSHSRWNTEWFADGPPLGLD